MLDLDAPRISLPVLEVVELIVNQRRHPCQPKLRLRAERPDPGRTAPGRAHVWLLPIPALRRPDFQVQLISSKPQLRPRAEIERDVVEPHLPVHVGKAAQPDEEAIVAASQREAPERLPAERQPRA